MNDRFGYDKTNQSTTKHQTMNLLQETKEAIGLSGHTETDIVFIGSEKSGHQCSWDEFCVLADVEYSAGFGAAEVAQDLIIVFADGQKLWRGEYDGSEWWEFSKPLQRPDVALPIKTLVCLPEQGGWVDLAECNEAAEA
jgi:hypothetical protein